MICCQSKHKFALIDDLGRFSNDASVRTWRDVIPSSPVLKPGSTHAQLRMKRKAVSWVNFINLLPKIMFILKLELGTTTLIYGNKI